MRSVYKQIVIINKIQNLNSTTYQREVCGNLIDCELSQNIFSNVCHIVQLITKSQNQCIIGVD